MSLNAIDSGSTKTKDMDDMPLTTVTTVANPSKIENEENSENNAEKDATDRLVPTVVDPVSGEGTVSKRLKSIFRFPLNSLANCLSLYIC